MNGTQLSTTAPLVGDEEHREGSAAAAHRGHTRRLSHFWGHVLEMFIAMWIGMALGGAVVGAIVEAFGVSVREAQLRYPEPAVLVMGLNMTVPMIAWMRYRGHDWRLSAEMAVAMLLPALLCILLLRAHLIEFGAACGLYSTSMTVAMVLLMVHRRDEFSTNTHRRIRAKTRPASSGVAEGPPQGTVAVRGRAAVAGELERPADRRHLASAGHH